MPSVHCRFGLPSVRRFHQILERTISLLLLFLFPLCCFYFLLSLICSSFFPSLPFCSYTQFADGASFCSYAWSTVVSPIPRSDLSQLSLSMLGLHLVVPPLIFRPVHCQLFRCPVNRHFLRPVAIIVLSLVPGLSGSLSLDLGH